jgi:hypothetical protein
MYIRIIQMLASNIWPPNVDTIKRSAAMDFVLSRQDTSMTGSNSVQSTVYNTYICPHRKGGYKLDLSAQMGARKYVGYLQHLGQKVICQMEIVHSVHKKILFCYTVKRGFRFSRPQPLTFFTVYPLA